MPPNSTDAKIDRVLESVGKLQADVASVKATLETVSQRNRDEIAALFNTTAEHGKRIAAVERDYTPRRAHDALEKQVHEARESAARERGAGAVRVAIVTALGMSALTLAANWVLRML